MIESISGNNLLAALRPDDLAQLAPHLQPKLLDAGHVLYEPGDDVRHVYFPRHHAMASFLVVMADGTAVETALVGREGATGGVVSNGHLPSFARSCVMHGGSFYRVSTTRLHEVKHASPHMRYLFARYADCMLAQVFQSVACNASHTLEQRAAKWLTTAMDRTGQDDVTMTQDQLASMLGVGRTYVSRIIRRLKLAGIVETRRGGLKVHDRAALAARACGCAQLVEAHFETVLAGVYPSADDGDDAEPFAMARQL